MINNFSSLYYVAFGKQYVEEACLYGSCANEIAVYLGVACLVKFLIVGNILELMEPIIKKLVQRDQKGRGGERRGGGWGRVPKNLSSIQYSVFGIHAKLNVSSISYSTNKRINERTKVK